MGNGKFECSKIIPNKFYQFKSECGFHSFKISVHIFSICNEIQLYVIIPKSSLNENTKESIAKFGSLPFLPKVWSKMIVGYCCIM
jgi:hypothetical protein